MIALLTICSVLTTFVILVLIRNELTFSIRESWIDEIFKEEDWRTLKSKFDKISYEIILLDFSIWGKISFQEYLKKKAKKFD